MLPIYTDTLQHSLKCNDTDKNTQQGALCLIRWRQLSMNVYKKAMSNIAYIL